MKVRVRVRQPHLEVERGGLRDIGDPEVARRAAADVAAAAGVG